jgi:hypothetical protein
MHKTNACNLNISKGHIHSYSHKLNKLACRYCKSSAWSIVRLLESATDPKLFSFAVGACTDQRWGRAWFWSGLTVTEHCRQGTWFLLYLELQSHIGYSDMSPCNPALLRFSNQNKHSNVHAREYILLSEDQENMGMFCLSVLRVFL